MHRSIRGVVALLAMLLAGAAGAQITGSLTGSPTVNSGTMSFGTQVVGTTGVAQTETLTAHLFTPTPPLPGGTTVRISTINSSNSEFQVTGGTCTSTPVDLPDAGTCTVQIAFQPGATGNRSGALNVQCSVVVAIGAVSFVCDNTLRQFMALAGIGAAAAVQTPVPALGREGLTALALLLMVGSLVFLARRR